jgi:hypothetical protein
MGIGQNGIRTLRQKELPGRSLQAYHRQVGSE